MFYSTYKQGLLRYFAESTSSAVVKLLSQRWRVSRSSLLRDARSEHLGAEYQTWDDQNEF